MPHASFRRTTRMTPRCGHTGSTRPARPSPLPKALRTSPKPFMPTVEPTRGGTFKVRHHVQPVHFDPHQTIAFPTMMALSYCMSRLVKVKAGQSVVPGTQPVENDLAESWQRNNDTTYTFKLRKGVRWHN